MSQFFLEQIQLGQDYLSRGIIFFNWKVFFFRSFIKIFTGDIDNGLDCFGKAVLVCSEPDSLMGYLQQSLPAELFQELVARIPRIAQVYFKNTCKHLIFIPFYLRILVAS